MDRDALLPELRADAVLRDRARRHRARRRWCAGSCPTCCGGSAGARCSRSSRGWTIVITHMVSGTGSMAYYALILTGGTLGTFMWYNVWFVIMPRQRLTIASAEAVAAGGQANPEAAKQAPLAGRASRTNVLFSIPMLFFMGAARHLALVHSEVPRYAPVPAARAGARGAVRGEHLRRQRDDAEAAGDGRGHDPHRARAHASSSGSPRRSCSGHAPP